MGGGGGRGAFDPVKPSECGIASHDAAGKGDLVDGGNEGVAAVNLIEGDEGPFECRGERLLAWATGDGHGNDGAVKLGEFEAEGLLG